MASTQQRTALAVKNEIATLRELGWPFTVQHGTYTTKIIKPQATTSYVTVQFRQRVFIAARMIKNDVEKSPYAQDIMQRQHFTKNYGNSDTITELKAPELLNIDIKSAYPNCMMNNGLISEKTASYLKSLDKHEKLPAIGLLARSYTLFHYDFGQCYMVDKFQADTAQIFFFLIQEIDRIMRDLKFILGRYFVYYWVDGIFFLRETPDRLIKEVEEYIASEGYTYSFELVQDFNYSNIDGDVRISMNKEGKVKEWAFTDSQRNESEVRLALMNEAIKLPGQHE